MAVVLNIPEQPDPYRREPHQPVSEVRLRVNDEFLTKLLGTPKRLHYISRGKVHYVHMEDGYSPGLNAAEFPEAFSAPSTGSMLLQALNGCYAAHRPISLRPEVLWYCISHQVAEFVRQNAERYARLFTSTPDTKQTIRVRDDSLDYQHLSDWMSALELFRKPLRQKLADGTADLFLPQFSTANLADEVSLLASLMDAASPYYGYAMRTCCHIPQIRLEGEPADWQTLYDSAVAMARTFDGLKGYFDGLLPVLQSITETATGRIGAPVDEEFWSQIYKKNGGSGGPYISGWITAFFAFIQDEYSDKPQLRDEFNWRDINRFGGGFTSDELPSHLSTVPFMWEYLGSTIPMLFAAGPLGVDLDMDDGNFLVPRLGFAVAEV